MGSSSIISSSANNSSNNAILDKFGITLRQLRNLTSLDINDNQVKINELGGITGLCRKLVTSQMQGLKSNPENLKHRRQVFGSNTNITSSSSPSTSSSPKQGPSFENILWASMKDLTLIALFIAAIISLILDYFILKNDYDEFHDNNTTKSNNDHQEIRLLQKHFIVLMGILAVVLITAIADYIKETMFDAARQAAPATLFQVLRDGESTFVSLPDLVVGDICLIKAGDIIPVDGILLVSFDLYIDESCLLGLPDATKKFINYNSVVYAGTHVIAGRGKFVTTAVGHNTMTGQISELMGVSTNQLPIIQLATVSNFLEVESSAKPKLKAFDKNSIRQMKKQQQQLRLQFPALTFLGKSDGDEDEAAEAWKTGKCRSFLQEKMIHLTFQIGGKAAILAFLAVFIAILRFCIYTYVINKEPFHLHHAQHLIICCATGLIVLILMIPESFPLAITVALGFSMNKLLKDGIYIKHVDALETMGNVTTVLVHKSGLLATKTLEATESYLCGTMYRSTPNITRAMPNSLHKLLVESIAVNTPYTSNVIPSQPGRLLPTEEERVHVGYCPIDTALLAFIADAGGDYMHMRRLYPEDQFKLVYAFNSVRKWNATLIPLKRHDSEGLYRLHVKGEAEILLNKCGFIHGANEELLTLNPTHRQLIYRNIIEKMQLNGLTTILIGYKNIKQEPSHWNVKSKAMINDIICLGIIGLQLTFPMQIPKVMKQFADAGIKVILLTGDNTKSASLLGKEIHLINNGAESSSSSSYDELELSSSEFNQLLNIGTTSTTKQNIIDYLWPRLKILGSLNPDDKLTLLEGIMNSRVNGGREEIVAVTGHKTCDGAALSKAHVGISTAECGCEIAYNSSDIILSNPKHGFVNLLKTVTAGRNLRYVLAQLIQFQLTASLVIVIVICMQVLLLSPIPSLNVLLQYLWIHIILDILAPFAFTSQNPTDDLLTVDKKNKNALNNSPYRRNSPLFTACMKRNMVGQIIYQLIVMLVLIFGGEAIFAIEAESHLSSSTISSRLEHPSSSKHLTFIFNTYVLMNLINAINCRQINGERNVFAGIYKHLYFVWIWGCCTGLQILIIEFGEPIFSTTHLNLQQWLWCLAFGLGSLVWNQLILTIPTN